MFCQFCGAQMADNAQFCTTCGRTQGGGFPVGAAGPAPFVAPVGVKARTSDWIGAGWEIVKADLGMLALITFVFALVNSVIPIILTGPLTVGVHIYCVKKVLNRRTDINDVIKGFNYFVPALVASLLISIFVGLGSLLCIIPGLVLAAMYSFTYLFILDKRMDFWPAMQASHAVVKNDYFGFTIFIVVMGLINILGALCCIVGLLVTVPITWAAITVAYKDVVGFEPGTESI